MIEYIMRINWAKLNNLLFVIPLFLVCCAILYYRIYRAKKAVNQLSAHRWTRQFLHNFSFAKLFIKVVLLGVAIIFLLLTLLHPQWEKKEETVAQKGRELFIALDISRSMLVRDCLPNRLECAKFKIKQLVKGLSSERIGLIIFSGTAIIQCPLTSDLGAFFMFLDQVDVETIASGTTALDRVIAKAVGAYQQMESRKTKLLVMFTDGEDFSTNLQHVKQQAQDQQLRIFTVGVGTTQGAPIPLIDDSGKMIGHIKDKKGSVVISHLNEEMLYAVAHDSGGTYIAPTANNDDIEAMIKHVQSFEKERLEDKKFATLQEQYPFFLIISFICFILEWLL